MKEECEGQSVKKGHMLILLHEMESTPTWQDQIRDNINMNITLGQNTQL